MENTQQAVTKLWNRSFVLVTLVNFLICTNTFMLMATLPVFIQHVGGVNCLPASLAGCLP